MKLIEYLRRSAVAPAFRDAIETFLATGQPAPDLRFNSDAPVIKVERTLTKLLESFPDLPIEAVEIRGESGCEYFRGELLLRTAEGERRVEFEWNCRWKATEMGWVDYFGLPDQIRAARELGHDCFRTWQVGPIELLSEA